MTGQSKPPYRMVEAGGYGQSRIGQKPLVHRLTAVDGDLGLAWGACGRAYQLRYMEAMSSDAQPRCRACQLAQNAPEG